MIAVLASGGHGPQPGQGSDRAPPAGRGGVASAGVGGGAPRLRDAQETRGLCGLRDGRQGQHGAEAAAGLTVESRPPVRGHPARRHPLTSGLPGAGLTQHLRRGGSCPGPLLSPSSGFSKVMAVSLRRTTPSHRLLGYRTSVPQPLCNSSKDRRPGTPRACHLAGWRSPSPSLTCPPHC